MRVNMIKKLKGLVGFSVLIGLGAGLLWSVFGTMYNLIDIIIARDILVVRWSWINVVKTALFVPSLMVLDGIISDGFQNVGKSIDE